MRGCGAAEKMEEIGGKFVNTNLDVLALSETNLRGKSEIVFGGERKQIWGE